MNTAFLHWIFFLKPVHLKHPNPGLNASREQSIRRSEIGSLIHSLICSVAHKMYCSSMGRNFFFWLGERLLNESSHIQNKLVIFYLIFEFENMYICFHSSNVLCELLPLVRDSPYKYSPNCSQHRRRCKVSFKSHHHFQSTKKIR